MQGRNVLWNEGQTDYVDDALLLFRVLLFHVLLVEVATHSHRDFRLESAVPVLAHVMDTADARHHVHVHVRFASEPTSS